jgi:hypothetical protein
MTNRLTKRELQAIFNATEPAEGDDPALASARQKVRDALAQIEQDRPRQIEIAGRESTKVVTPVLGPHCPQVDFSNFSDRFRAAKANHVDR